MGRDKAHMAFLANHWMGAICIALAGPLVAMSVDVRYDRHLFSAAKIPERYEASAVKDDDTGVQRRRIQVVVADELRDLPRALFTQQECAAFAFTATPSAKFAHQAEPKPDRDMKSVMFHNREGSDTGAQIPSRA